MGLDTSSPIFLKRAIVMILIEEARYWQDRCNDLNLKNQTKILNGKLLISCEIQINFKYVNIIQQKTAIQLGIKLGVDTINRYLRKAEIEIRTYFWMSHKSELWLQQIEQEQQIRLIREYHIPETRYRTDGYCEETNTIYEFYGGYWCGKPDLYEPDILNEVTRKPMRELYQQTINRENYLEELGYDNNMGKYLESVIKWNKY